MSSSRRRPGIFVSRVQWFDDGKLIATRAIRPEHSAGSTMLRTRRAAGPASATIDRSISPAPGPIKKSIRLTVKAPPSRLREITSRSVLTSTPAPLRDTLSRNSKNKRPIVDESSEDETGQDEIEDDDDIMDDEDEDESDAQGEESDGDITALHVPPPKNPSIRISAPQTIRKPSPAQLLKQHSNSKSVEDKELEPAATDDDLISELASQDDNDDPEEDDEEIDAENDLIDEAGDTITAVGIESDELDSDSDRSGNPDLTKLTRRQRATYESLPADASGSHLMALSNEAQKKKFFTDEQITMRRVEMARRRKDLSDKRMQEEKEGTLKRLLTKQAPKRRSRAQMMADAEREDFAGGTWTPDGVDLVVVPKPNKLFVRTVIGRDGTRVGVPIEWLGTPVGRVFEGEFSGTGISKGLGSGKMVEIIE